MPASHKSIVMTGVLSGPIAERGVAEAPDQEEKEEADPEAVLHVDAPERSRHPTAGGESFAGTLLSAGDVGIRDEQPALAVCSSYDSILFAAKSAADRQASPLRLTCTDLAANGAHPIRACPWDQELNIVVRLRGFASREFFQDRAAK